MSFPRYSQYKDSGVEWLGEVPSHWGVSPLFSVANECDEPNKGMLQDNLLSLSYGNIIRKDINANDGLLPESFETYQIVRRGDIVLRLTDLQNDQRSLRSALVGEVGIITSAYTAIRPMYISSSYLSFLLRAYDVQKIFYSMGGGLRQSMKFSDLRRLPVLLPSEQEQIQIAAFLDRETGKIDALVSEQENLIELLKEKRQAVISHAVTKGLDASAPMKDSGIEWLGEVPAHWKTFPLRRMLTGIEQGWSPQTEATPAELGERAVIKLSAIKDGLFWSSENKSLPSEADYDSRYEIGSGDFLLTRANTPELVGECCVVPESVQSGLMIPDLVYRLKLHADCAPEFLKNYLRSSVGRAIIASDARGSSMSMAKISQEHIRSWATPAPPPDEQHKIAQLCDAETKRINSLISEALRAIELLKEHRSALISAAVTGKIDVRGLVSPQEAAA